MITLIDILSSDELNKIKSHDFVDVTKPILKLTAEELSKLFMFINLKIVTDRQGYLPEGFIVSHIWNELGRRAIEKNISIYP